MKVLNRLFVWLALIIFFVGCSSQQNLQNKQYSAVEKAVQQVKGLYFDRDFALAQKKGARLVEQHPESVKLRAWHLASLAQDNNADKAVSNAERLAADYPDNSWSYFAVALTNSNVGKTEKATAAAEKALSLNPGHPDLLWMRAKVFADPHRAIAFVDSAENELDNPGRLLTIKGSALAKLSNDTTDQAKEKLFNAALAAFEESREFDSSCFAAWYLPASYLNEKGETKQALELYKKAVTLTTAIGPHAEYWRLLIGMDGMSQDNKEELVTSDMHSLADRRPETPELLYSFANHHEKLGLGQKSAHYKEKIVEDYPKTVYAEWILASRFREHYGEHHTQIYDDPDLQVIAEYRDLLWDFINHPFHDQNKIVARAYRKLFKLYDAHDLTDKDRLSRIVSGLEKYNAYNVKVTRTEVAELMAAQKVDLAKAEHIARDGVEKERKKFEISGSSNYEIREGMGPYISGTYDALGWVFFRQGKVDSAEKYLTKAYSLDKENRQVIYHLGCFYDKQDRNEKAEKYFIKGAKMDAVGENPNWAVLKSLYVEMNGSAEGYAQYRENIKAERQNRQKIEALATWKKDPEPLKPFHLKSLDGDSVSSKQLEGKITVINIWGTWCAPCVREMPEFQKFYQKYKDDPDVEILTINNDPNAEKVRNWMAERGYDFPVLQDDGYLQNVNMHQFPTTWFLNTEGGVAFVKVGYTGNLIDKFTWRIEALKRSQRSAENRQSK